MEEKKKRVAGGGEKMKQRARLPLGAQQQFRRSFSFLSL
jgi:hypothetical protein